MAVPRVSLALMADAPHWKEMLLSFPHVLMSVNLEEVPLSGWSYHRDVLSSVSGVLVVLRDVALVSSVFSLWKREFPEDRHAFLMLCLPKTLVLSSDDVLDPRVTIVPLPLSIFDFERRLESALESVSLPKEVGLGKARLLLAERVVECGGKHVAVTEKEVALLMYLVEHFPRVVSRAELLEKVFGYHVDADSHTVETHIYRLRQKIESLGSGECIVTRDGGYAIHGVVGQ